MNKGLTGTLKSIFPNIVAAQRSIINNQIIKSPLWLLGFVDGEGCFYLKITRKKQILLSFSINLHYLFQYIYSIFFNKSTLSFSINLQYLFQ